MVVGRPHEHWFKQPIFASIVSSITRMATDRQISVRIEEVLDAGKVSDRIHSSVVDGALVFVASDARLELLEAVRSRLPVVRVAGDDLVSLSIDQVRGDNLAVGHLAYDYLAQCGCRQMACVTTRPGHGGIFLRTMAFAATAVREGNIRPTLYVTGDKPIGPVAGVDTVECNDLDDIAAKLAKSVSGQGPLGLFATQDIETIGLFPFLARHNLRPGHDVHLVSCNNDQSLAMLSPRPATIDLDAASIGKWALRRLLNRISRPDDAPIQILVKPRLVRPEHAEPI
ncbi:MAG: substrate-binding domain-containing protein [Tepidisphaeraceae bacterium]